MTYNRIIIISIVCILLFAGAWILIAQKKNSPTLVTGDLPDFSSINFSGKAPASNSPSALADNTSVSEWTIYTNTRYHFSLKYPEGYIQNELPSADGATTITFAKKGNLDYGFQIHIAAFDESPAVLTPDRIKKDIPDISMTDPQPFHFGDVAQGVAFGSSNESGETREMWFATKSYLYQVTAPAVFYPTLQKVLGTWKFK